MTRMLINVGNSRTVVVLSATGGEVREELLSRPTPRTENEAEALALRVAAVRPDGVAAGITSVVPMVTAALAASLDQLLVVDHTCPLPFELALEHPETVGSDRLCNVAAAVSAGLEHALVVDAGTATTIDVLSHGVFVGGLIAPGMAFAAEALQEAGARLWSVPFAATELRPGRSTEEALGIGAYHVGRQGVLGTVSGLLEQFPASTVVVTGGLARHLQQPGWRVDPHWTFRGLHTLMNG